VDLCDPDEGAQRRNPATNPALRFTLHAGYRAEHTSPRVAHATIRFPRALSSVSEDPMAKLGTVSVTGASGQRYELSVYPSADQFKPLGAVFFLSKRIPFAEGEAEYTWVYVGETADISRWSPGLPTACIDAQEANSICLLMEEDAARRRTVVRDIAKACKPPCNA
jgi:hypothetical protein